VPPRVGELRCAGGRTIAQRAVSRTATPSAPSASSRATHPVAGHPSGCSSARTARPRPCTSCGGATSTRTIDMTLAMPCSGTRTSLRPTSDHGNGIGDPVSLNTLWQVYCPVCWNIALGAGREPSPWREVTGRGRWQPQVIVPVRWGSRVAGEPRGGEPTLPADPSAHTRQARRKVWEDCPRHRWATVPPRPGDYFTLTIELTPEQAAHDQLRERERRRQQALDDRLCAVCGAPLTGRAGQLTCRGSACRKAWSREGLSLAEGHPFNATWGR